MNGVKIRDFEAVRYRGINGLRLEGLTGANLITGVNGLGKTALVEAIWLFTGRHNTTLLWNTNVQRSLHPVVDPIGGLSEGCIELRGTEKGNDCVWKVEFEPVEQVVEEVLGRIGNTQETVQIPVVGRLHSWINEKKVNSKAQSKYATPIGAVLYDFPPQPKTSHISIIEGTSWHLATPDEYLQRYSEMVRQGHKRELTNAINLILPGISDIELLTDKTGKSYLSATTSTNSQLPLQSLGGGVVRLFRLCLNLFTARGGGMVLIDEIENGMHYSVLRNLWALVRNSMHDWNVQFVATTHSGECIDAAVDAFAENTDDLSVHQLFNIESGAVRATTFTGESLTGAKELNLEMR